MPDMISAPPWKEAGTNGYKYKKTVEEGYFLETLSLIASRLVDLNETLKNIDVSIAALVLDKME